MCPERGRRSNWARRAVRRSHQLFLAGLFNDRRAIASERAQFHSCRTACPSPLLLIPHGDSTSQRTARVAGNLHRCALDLLRSSCRVAPTVSRRPSPLASAVVLPARLVPPTPACARVRCRCVSHGHFATSHAPIFIVRFLLPSFSLLRRCVVFLAFSRHVRNARRWWQRPQRRALFLLTPCIL